MKGGASVRLRPFCLSLARILLSFYIYALFLPRQKMRIIVAGIGEVGTHLAHMLSGGVDDIIAIDPLPEHLRHLETMADLVTIEGSAASIAVLKAAEIEKCDLFIAVAHYEETNIISAILAKKLGAKKVIARVDSNELLTPENQQHFKELGIDSLIYPEKLASQVIIGLLGSVGTVEYVDFSNGQLVLAALKAEHDMKYIGRTLQDVARMHQGDKFRIVAILRDGNTIIPYGDEMLLQGDMLYIISSKAGIATWRNLLGASKMQVDNLMVLGASRIGMRTCLDLEGTVKNIKLIESDREKCERLAPLFTSTIWVNGDGRDRELLLDEGLEHMDAFVAATGNSETNIMACLMARKAGVPQIIAEVENIDYISLAEGIGIDSVVNKKLITASRIFQFTMGSTISSMRCLTNLDAEVLEYVARDGAPATRGRIKDLNFPRLTIAGGIIRGGDAFIATGETQIQTGDRVVIFTLNPAHDRLDRFFS